MVNDTAVPPLVAGPAGVNGRAIGGAVVVVVGSGSGSAGTGASLSGAGSNSRVGFAGTAIVGRSGGGCTATAAPTPPAARRTATAATPRSVPAFPNTLLPSSYDDFYEVLVRSLTAVFLRTFVEITGPIDAQISMRWHQWRHRAAYTRGPSGPRPTRHFARSPQHRRPLQLKVHVGVAE